MTPFEGRGPGREVRAPFIWARPASGLGARRRRDRLLPFGRQRDVGNAGLRGEARARGREQRARGRGAGRGRRSCRPSANATAPTSRLAHCPPGTTVRTRIRPRAGAAICPAACCAMQSLTSPQPLRQRPDREIERIAGGVLAIARRARALGALGGVGAAFLRADLAAEDLALALDRCGSTTRRAACP